MKNTNTKIDSFCRERRSYSISPSVSFDNSVILTEEERKEKNYYGATRKEMAKELFLTFDDIIRHVNYNLVNHLRSLLKNGMTSEESENMIQSFLDITFKEFTFQFDKGERNLDKFLTLEENNKDIIKYVVTKNKKNSKTSKNEINSNFDTVKNEYFDLVRENLRLKLELQIQKEINQYRKSLEQKNISFDDSFIAMSNYLQEKPSFSIIDHNLDIIENQFKQMNDEIDNL